MAVAGDPNNPLLLWKDSNDGRIPCPPKEIGGCGASSLELQCFLPENMLSELEHRANKVIKREPFANTINKTSDRCPCFDHSSKIRTKATRQAANRKGSSDNYLYCPDAMPMTSRRMTCCTFRCIVIVSDVLRLTSGLSWEPLVMWRALREKDEHLTVKAVDCLDWSEVNILMHTAEVSYEAEQLDKITKTKKKMREQDLQELCGVFESGTVHMLSSPIESKGLDTNALPPDDSGSDVGDRPSFYQSEVHIALYNVQFSHPIHDQVFYLTAEHKRKLKKEHGVEPWTFEQKLRDAVFIPAGCPHQVRNLKVHLDIPPLSIVIKMIALNALKEVVNFLDPLSEGSKSRDD
uniref:JmjC domain-containing protein n=1 Tax=Oryza punctata TaxID=4537 RepID=A0A0E0KFB9_ORYPU